MTPALYEQIHQLVWHLVPPVQVDVRMVFAVGLVVVGLFGMWHVERRHK